MGEIFAGRYELVDLVGQGGMGAVWRAWDRRDGGYLAAKVLRQSNATSLLRFVREQGVRIPHRHVLAPRSWVAEDERVLFTMDLVSGGSVATLVGDHGGLHPAYAACLLDQLLDGLDAIHQAGVVHRDLKPANLLLEVTGTGVPRVRITDFGIALQLGEPRLTETSHIVGTPGYLPPEQLYGADPSPLQDLFGVGAIGVELLTGQRPERNEFGIPRLPSERPPAVPPPLWDFLMELAAPAPNQRPPSAGAARETLAGLAVVPRADPSGRRAADGGPLPWQVAAEQIEVFDQLAPLPTGWGPDGPARPSGPPAVGGGTAPAGPGPSPLPPRASGPAAPSPAAQHQTAPQQAAHPPNQVAPNQAVPHQAAPSPAAPDRPRRRRRVALVVASCLLLAAAAVIAVVVVVPELSKLGG